MKKRNLIIIVAVAIVGVVALIVALNGSKKSTFAQDYHVEDINSVTKLFLADKQNNEVTLTRGEDSIWVIDGRYEANKAMVDLLLETLNTMRIRQQVNRQAIPNVVKDIAAHGIKVEVYQHKPLINWFGGRLKLFPREKLTVTYYVGRETQDMMASFMFREGDKVPYIIHIPGFRGFLTPRFVTEPIKWRSHRIVELNVRQIERVELQIPASPEESFAIVRDGEGFALEMLANHQRVNGFDTARVAQMLSAFAFLNFDEFASIVPNSLADSCVSGTPRAILSITNTNGVTRQLKTYTKYSDPNDLEALGDEQLTENFDLNRLYAIIDNIDTVLIQYYIFDNILQPASYFLGQDKTGFAR